MKMTRRSFNALSAASLGAALVPSWLSSAAEEEKPFHFAVVSDSHVIDKFYKPGSENGVEDNESILKANDHLVMARDTINGVRFHDGSVVEKVFLPGDVFHNYPSPDYDFYFQNETRIDIAKKLLDGFKAPVHMGWGNHDYDVPRVSREMSHRLFKEKLKTDPYYAVDYKGFRFLHLNNFLGATWDKSSPEFKKDFGSLGEAQLQWAEAQLATRKPTMIFIHYPLWIVR
ncbi:MAG TPA: metallophosphoesterase, partial [Terriglobus sp.]